MSLRLVGSLVFLLLVIAPAAGAQPAAPITAEQLRRHVDVLASDRFEGRAPGTEGERLTADYIVRELSRRGAMPAAEGGGWLQQVRVVRRVPIAAQAGLVANGRSIPLSGDALVLTGHDPQVRIAGAPVIFAGHGARIPERGIDQLAGTDFRGAVALILYEGPEVEGFPSFAERIRTLAEAGASAVIGIVDPDLPWERIRAAAARGSSRLDQSGGLPAAWGVVSWQGAAELARAAGADLTRLINEQPGSSFRSVALPLRADIEVRTDVQRIVTNNVIGRIGGSSPSGQAVLLLAHWDHLGLCRPPGAPDRICNGAVDNASGLATLIEAAGRLAGRGGRSARDVLILATTAEEMGLLGAEAFARSPPVPRESIVAALNVDTAAVAPAGTPIAMIGGTPAMRQLVQRVALGLGRRVDTDNEADAMAQRQDGWALTRHGIPAMMATSNASDMQLLQRFLSGTYHGPGDQPSAAIEYGGAVEDANLLVALVRAFADPELYPVPPPGERG